MCVMFCVILCAMHVCNVSPFEEKGIGCYVLPDTPYVCMCDYSLGRARLHHGTTCEHCVTYMCVCVCVLSEYFRKRGSVVVHSRPCTFSRVEHLLTTG